MSDALINAERANIINLVTFIFDQGPMTFVELSDYQLWISKMP